MAVPATVYLSESNGAGEVVTDDIANVNFGGVDLVEVVPADHPIIRTNTTPTPDFSFNKALRYKVQSMGDSLLIQDLRTWKTSGVYVSGEGILFNNAIVYAAPSQASVGGIQYPVANPGTANVKIGGNLAGTIVAAPTYSDYFGLQLFINGNSQVTPIGAVNQKIFIFQYDES
jgi:hypothetical protein